MGSPDSPFRSVCDRVRGARHTSPDAVALKCGNDTLSYRELDTRAAHFAGYLAQRGVKPGAAVAICMDRSLDWIVAALGILRLGALYVPLDPAWPEARVRFALEDSGAAALVARSALLRVLRVEYGVDPSRDQAAIATAPVVEDYPNDPSSLAYLIYTSGSTGAPKGVEITHANLAHLIDWHLGAFEVTSADRASHLAGLGFDAAVWEIWPTLAAGASLTLADDAVRLSPELMQEWIISEGITIGFVPTVHAASLIGMNWPEKTPLRILLTGGDALAHGPAFPLPFKLVNNYGPTECTVVATSCVVKAGSIGTPTIGSPVTGATAYLLDTEGNLVPEGQVGELYIGGAGVGHGYRNLPDATRKSFLPDPFAGVPGARMYRTGDCGLRREDGQLEFHGRIDRQVKIRGQRIELDEIGISLNQHPAVHFSAVTAVKSAGNKVQLVAYVLPKDDCQAPSAPELQKFLLGNLPSYMVPGTFLRLREIPVSANGKLDVARLPDVVMAPLLGREEEKEASTQVEGALLSLVRDVLQSDSVGPTDNFLLAGGHSLLGMQLILRVRNKLGVDLALRQLFDAPTVQELAHEIESMRAQERLTAIWKSILKAQHVGLDTDFEDLSGESRRMEDLQRRIHMEFGRYFPMLDLVKNNTIRKQAALLYGDARESPLPPGMVALQPEGQHNGLFWLHYPCLTLAKALGETRPFFCLMITEEDLERLGPSPSLQEIATILIPKILKAQPSGPYLLGGFCLGGILSYEVACQMQAAGHEISQLVLLDTPSPEYYRPAHLKSLLKRPSYLTRRVRQLGLRRTVSNLVERAAKRLPNTAEPEVPQLLDEYVQSMLEVAAFRYRPSIFHGKAKLILASELPPNSPPHEDFLPWWKVLIKQELQTETVSGLHENLIKSPAVFEVAQAITSYLTVGQGVLA